MLLFNLKAYNGSHDPAEREKLAGEMRAAVPVLGRLGFFELFSAEEWCAEGGRRGGGEEVGVLRKEDAGSGMDIKFEGEM